jgi:hypothetical protein
MERRTFIKGAFYSLAATIGALLPLGRQEGNVIDQLSLVNDAQAQSGDFPVDNCRNRTKGLTRCKAHSGSCEGGHHVCNSHSGRCQAQVQCKVRQHRPGMPGR